MADQSQAMHLPFFQTSQAATAWREKDERGTDVSHTKTTESGEMEATVKTTSSTFLHALSVPACFSLILPLIKENLQVSQSMNRLCTCSPGQLYLLKEVTLVVQRS